MREIEIKARVRDEQAVLKNLSEHGIEFDDALSQHDIVFGRKKDGKFIHGENWLRVRIENEAKVYFTLKRSISSQLDNIEHEVVVGDADTMISIMKELGFEQYSDITKNRRKAKYKNIEICLDEVPRLGTFIEAEVLTGDDADEVEVQKDLWEFFESIGIDKSQEETNGYDVLMRLKDGQGV